jgi:hypothetical protein
MKLKMESSAARTCPMLLGGVCLLVAGCRPGPPAPLAPPPPRQLWFRLSHAPAHHRLRLRLQHMVRLLRLHRHLQQTVRLRPRLHRRRHNRGEDYRKRRSLMRNLILIVASSYVLILGAGCDAGPLGPALGLGRDSISLSFWG